MPVTLRIALRDWDYMTPLVLGDVSSSRLDIKVDSVGTLVSSL
ncbi:nitrate ABC transporter substrate-binding protein, partial [Rhizobium leguminosarum]